MMRFAAPLTCLAPMAAADSLACEVAAPCPTGGCEAVAIAFDINRDEFAPAHDPNEPPRRKVTTVQMGNARFPAEAIVMGESRGFWAEGGGGAHVLFMVHADGSAFYIDDRTGLRMEGTCAG